MESRTRTRTEYSILNIIAGVGGYGISIGLSMINRMVFTRTLSPEYLGISGLFTNILSMLSLAELGIGSAITFALYKPLAVDDKKKVASIVNLFGRAYRIIGCIIGCLGLCILPFLKIIIGEHPNIQESIYVIFGLYLFNTASSYFFTYRSTLLIAAQQNYLNTGLNYLIISVQTIIQIIYLIVTKNYLGYLVIQVIGTLTYNILISKVATKKYPYIIDREIIPLNKDEKKLIFKDVRDLMIYKISGILVNSTDNIIVTIFNGLSLTGLASNYTLLVNTLSGLFNQVFNGLTASIGNLNAIESKEKRLNTLNIINLMNFWIFGCGAVGIIFVSDDLVKLLFGYKYVLGNEITIALALNFYTVGMMNAIWTFKHTMGMFKYGRFIQFGTMFFNLMFSILLGHAWGLFGVLFATFLSRLFTNLWYDPYVVYKKGFNVSPLLYIKKYILYFIVLLVSVLITGIICNYIYISAILNVILKMIVCLLVTNIVFFIAFYKTQEFTQMKKIILKGVNIITSKFQKSKTLVSDNIIEDSKI